MIEKKVLIEVFANELAKKQMKADMFYYKYKNTEIASLLLGDAIMIKELSIKL